MVSKLSSPSYNGEFSITHKEFSFLSLMHLSANDVLPPDSKIIGGFDQRNAYP